MTHYVDYFSQEDAKTMAARLIEVGIDFAVEDDRGGSGLFRIAIPAQEGREDARPRPGAWSQTDTEQPWINR